MYCLVQILGGILCISQDQAGGHGNSTMGRAAEAQEAECAHYCLLDLHFAQGFCMVFIQRKLLCLPLHHDSMTAWLETAIPMRIAQLLASYVDQKAG